jgi:SAM-dependent methyltransferase
MDEENVEAASYDAEGVAQLETIWGEGFMSPGGPAEVGRIVAGVAIAGTDVLDIGCGTGGAALALAAEHGAGSVTGVDVEPYVVRVATQRAAARGLSGRVRFQQVTPGPLPFADESFDVVFSKDAIVHVEDKRALYAEARRVLRPGGRLCIGDWFRGEGAGLDAAVEDFIATSGEEFFMRSLPDCGALVKSVGFLDVDLEDRCDWYHGEAIQELARLRGVLRDRFRAELGQEMYDGTLTFWEVLVEATGRGVLRPGHICSCVPGRDARST